MKKEIFIPNETSNGGSMLWLRRVGVAAAATLWAILGWMTWHGAFRESTGWSAFLPWSGHGPHYAAGTGGFVIVAVLLVAMLAWARAFVAATVVGFFLLLFGGWYLLSPLV